MRRVSRKNCPGRKLRWLLPKTPPKSFFRKTRFRSKFIYKTTPHLFSQPNKLCGAFRGKIVPGENFTRFCLKRPRNRFRVKHVSSPNFFTKLPPHLFSGPNGLCGTFRGKIVSDENFARSFGPKIGEGGGFVKTDRKRVFRKNDFGAVLGKSE
jgi:hypothetical protein